jgi:hypothetical protein
MQRAIVIALVQILLICSLGAKLLYDRKTCPQAWFKAQQYDPNLPIRGRYISLQLELRDPLSRQELEARFGKEIHEAEASREKYHLASPIDFGQECGTIAVQDGVPVAVFGPGPYQGENWKGPCEKLQFWRRSFANGDMILRITEPVLFFVPDNFHLWEHVSRGDEMWVLATIPRKGPPRPIALGVKKAGESGIHRLAID